MKTAEELRLAANKRQITRWNIHECSICGMSVGYIFRGDFVYFDGGCDCADGGLQLSDWQDVTACYNLNAGADDVEIRIEQSPLFRKYVEETKTFWGF